MLSVDATHSYTLDSGEYTLTSAGFMGGKQVLVAHTGPSWLRGKSFLGDDQLSRDGSPITIIKLQRRIGFGFISRALGKPEYMMIQDGFYAVTMIEGTADDIVEVLITDRNNAPA